ncbi:PTS sugar transporter subunit IIA [Caproiciproducens sp. AGMB10547]|uniref:PTS sugar transporter subunit IIA n=2 Tax=Caproiciproducens faecalis TaxID=2820301 RepID=A0ABS7DPE1_9FIRM|nr:PTS sugar transporter subunit IIA [Caproiciproducens faecalis]
MGSILNERFILLNADVKSFEDCIFLMAARFEESGAVQPGYGDAVAEREKTLPTGLRGKGVNLAIPHADGRLVIEPAVGIITPKKPVQCRLMGEPGTAVDCELIMPLAIRDSRQQIGLLKKIMKILNSEQLLEKIRKSESKPEILELLKDLNSDL